MSEADNVHATTHEWLGGALTLYRYLDHEDESHCHGDRREFGMAFVKTAGDGLPYATSIHLTTRIGKPGMRGAVARHVPTEHEYYSHDETCRFTGQECWCEVYSDYTHDTQRDVIYELLSSWQDISKHHIDKRFAYDRDCPTFDYIEPVDKLSGKMPCFEVIDAIAAGHKVAVKALLTTGEAILTNVDPDFLTQKLTVDCKPWLMDVHAYWMTGAVGEKYIIIGKG